jgi:hypothetical protein
LFELVSPPSRGIVDFDKVITRYEQRMAMVVLAQFIFLGMTKVGTQALAETTVDVFQLAITAWADMLAAVVNRFAIPRLIALNPFKLEALPTLEHSDIAVPNLAEVAAFVNQAVGAEVLTPDERLEAYLRELAGLPERAEVAIEVTGAAAGEEATDVTLEKFCEVYALKTILGALAREEESGRFARGTGAALSEEEQAAAFLGEALVSGKASPAQSRQLTRLGLMERKAGKTVLTGPGRELARVLGRKPRQGVKTLAALLAKAGVRPKKRRAAKVGAAGKKARGKAKKAKGGKKKKAKGGKAKTEKEEKTLEEKKGVLDRLIEDGGLSPDMAEAFLLIYESENPNLAAGEYDEAILGAMGDLGLLTGEGKVTDDGKRLARALRNEDWDAIGQILGESLTESVGEEFVLLSSDVVLVDEEFVQRLRQGGPKWERATNAYELELRRTYQAWVDDTAKALAEIDDEQEFDEKLDEAVEALVAALVLLGRRGLPEAYQLGLADLPSSPQGIQELSEALVSNEDFLLNSFGPDVRSKMRQRVSEEPLIRTDKVSLAAVLATFLARVGSYAGAFWTLVQRGFGDRVRQDPGEPKVRWVLDARAKHCETCLANGSVAGKVYDSFDDLLNQTGGALPAWGTRCDGNCRCWLEVQAKSGAWVRA